MLAPGAGSWLDEQYRYQALTLLQVSGPALQNQGRSPKYCVSILILVHCTSRQVVSGPTTP